METSRLLNTLENCNGCKSFETQLYYKGYLITMCILYQENYRGECPCTNCVVKVICDKENSNLCQKLRNFILKYDINNLSSFKTRALACPIVEEIEENYLDVK